MQMEKRYIPWALTAARAVLGPLLMAGEKCGWNGFTLAGLILAALLSDVFDGALARRWHCDTTGAGLFDSMTDTFFYACVAVALWLGHPAVWAIWRNPVLLLLAFEGARIAFDLLKFGKPASYHSYLAKTWGLVLGSAIITLFAIGHARMLMTVAVALGVLCSVEGLAMSLLLPVWRSDVKTLAVAWRMRTELRAERPELRPLRSTSPTVVKW